MAMLTRFVSSAPSTPSINRVNMDPGAASMATQAGVEGANKMAAADQQLVGTIQGAIEEHVQKAQKAVEKVDDSFLTNAKANIEVDYNDAYNKSLGEIQPGGAFDKHTSQLFQTTSAPWVEKAPNEATRQRLINSLIPMSAQSIKRAQNEQYRVNSDQAFVDMSNYAQKAPMMAVNSPEAQATALDRIDQMGASMKKQGIQGFKVDEAVRKNKALVNEAVTVQYAEKDPFNVLDALSKGEIENLDHSSLSRVKTRAQATINGYVKDSDKALNTLNTQMVSGQALPDNAITVIDSAISLADKLNNPQLKAQALRTAEIAEVSKQLTSASYADLKKKQAELLVGAGQSSNPDMTAFKLQQNLVNNRVKVVEDDPLSYGLIQDKGMKLPELPDPTSDISDEDIQKVMSQRSLYADQYSQMMGIPVPVTQKYQLENIAQKFDSLTPQQQEKQLKILAMSGSDQAGLIADKLAPLIAAKDGTKYKALAPTIALMGQDPKLASEVLKGQQLMANNQINFTITPQDITDSVGATYGGLFADDPKRAQQFVEAAKALTASQISSDSRAGKSVDLKEQKDAFQANLMRVSNAVKLEQDSSGWVDSKYSTIAPKWGMTANDFREEIQGLDNNALLQYGNGAPSLQGNLGKKVPLDASKVGDFQFVPVKFGQYMLMRGGRKVTTEDGNDYVFNFANYLKSNGR